MFANIVSAIAALPGWNLSLLLLLTKATIILIAALGITLSMPRASAGARHLVWLVTLGTLLLVPVLAAWAPLRLAILPASTVAASQHGVLDATTAAPRLDSPVDQSSALQSAPRDPAASVVSEVSEAPAGLGARLQQMSTTSMIVAVWGLVLAGIIASLAWAGLAVRRIVRHATPLTSPDWVNPMFEIADRLGLEEAPRLVQSDVAKMPFACGMLAPTIVLPSEAESWTLDRRRAVLLHELAHVRRRDLLGHTLGRLTCAVYWFHPLVWTAAKKLRNESERACDDLALSCGTRATDYAEHLLDIVTSVRGDSTPLVALAMARRKEFEGRMLAILDPELRHSTPSRKQSLSLAGVLALVSLTVAAAAPVQREAVAAVVPQATQPAEKPFPAETERLAVQAHPAMKAYPASKAYPDSGVRGASAMASVSTSQNETSSITLMHTARTDLRVDNKAVVMSNIAINAPVAPALPAVPKTVVSNPTNGDIAIDALQKAGVKFGISVASSALEGIGQALSTIGDKGDKGSKGSKNPDDRPMLLAKVLKSDTSASLRRIAAWGLREYTESQVASDALASALKRDSDASVREMAAWSLGSGGDRTPAALSSLASALKSDANEKVRATSAWSLGSMGDDGSADALVAALGDASAEVRTRVAWALGNVEPKTAPRALVALLNDKDMRTREIAAWALYQIQDPSTAPALQAALKTEQNKDVQIAYIRAIAAMGEKSVDALRDLLESSDPRVKGMAVRALAGGHAAGPWPWPMPMPRPFP
ncbi:MAG: HEAT repeat domain-containing protein [bacterium]